MVLELKEDDVLMCTVKKIDGATVFLEIDGNGQGSMVMSEVAAGRIRNLRDYVFPGKKVICKVLKIIGGHPQLSLRRVSAKEKKEVEEKYKKEKIFLSLLKNVSKSPEKIMEKIKEAYEISEFFDKAKEKPQILEDFLPKKEAEELAKLIAEKKEKEKIAKKTISLKSLSESGINDIKAVLQSAKNVGISYLGSSKFLISAKAHDFKEANHKVLTAIESIKLGAKQKKLLLEVLE
ncbi:MAG: hypothetical protein QXD13_02425 [Candidatus Pacearchaeota archaeon]